MAWAMPSITPYVNQNCQRFWTKAVVNIPIKKTNVPKSIAFFAPNLSPILPAQGETTAETTLQIA